MGVKGGRVGSIDRLRSAVKRGSGDMFIQNIRDGVLMTVRFLTEPTEWYAYLEHFDAAEKRMYPCTDDCKYCETSEDRPAQRWLANALDIGETKVIPLKLPKSLVDKLLKKFERFGTLTDRDYEMERSGSGKDTEYDTTPLAPKKRTLSRYELLDLEEILNAQLDGDDEEGGEDEPPKRSGADKSAARARLAAQRTRRTKAEPEDDDDEYGDAVRIRRPGQARREKEEQTRKAGIARDRKARIATTKKTTTTTNTVRRPARRRTSR